MRTLGLWAVGVLGMTLAMGCTMSVGGPRAPGTPAVKSAAERKKTTVNTLPPEVAKEAESHRKATELQYISITDREIDLHTGVAVNFGSDSAVIQPDSFDLLVEVATALDEHKDLKIRVEGHTDATGGGTPAGADHNLQLSIDRAFAVYDFLKTWGIGEERLDFAGCGQDYPTADNTSTAGQAQNRRVEFVITKDDPAVCTSLLPQ
jgi:outer membrane protein OmpA-like peptidoglycan-associated protein